MNLTDLLADKPVEAALNSYKKEMSQPMAIERMYEVDAVAHILREETCIKEALRAAWEAAELAAKAESELLDSSCAPSALKQALIDEFRAVEAVELCKGKSEDYFAGFLSARAVYLASAIAVLDSSCAFADGWHDAAKAPFVVWLLTYRLGEKGYNVTMRINEDEWVDREGATTITHHSFAAPTHFLWGKEAADAFIKKMNTTPPPATSESAMREALIEECAAVVEAANKRWWANMKARDNGKEGEQLGSLADYIASQIRALQPTPAKERG